MKKLIVLMGLISSISTAEAKCIYRIGKCNQEGYSVNCKTDSEREIKYKFNYGKFRNVCKVEGEYKVIDYYCNGFVDIYLENEARKMPRGKKQKELNLWLMKVREELNVDYENNVWNAYCKTKNKFKQ